MHRHTFTPFISSVLLITATATAEGPKSQKDEAERLPPYSHEFYWESFTVSADVPVAGNGRYRLKSVQRDGSVELVCLAATALYADNVSRHYSCYYFLGLAS